MRSGGSPASSTGGLRGRRGTLQSLGFKMAHEELAANRTSEGDVDVEDNGQNCAVVTLGEGTAREQFHTLQESTR